MNEDCFLLPRRCLLEPLPEIARAAGLLSEAVDAHLCSNRTLAERLFAAADMPAIAKWLDSVWGKQDQSILRVRPVPDSPPYFSLENRPKPRMPTHQTKSEAVARDGYHCRFCGIPVIDPKIRNLLRAEYPGVVRWGASNAHQHAAFQAMWLQYDHVLPNSRGGDSSVENIVVACAACNFGRMERTLGEVGLIDPRERAITNIGGWDGLQRVLRVKGAA